MCMGWGWGEYADNLPFLFLKEDNLKEVEKIKRQNLNLEQCTIQKFVKYLPFRNHHSSANFVAAL